MESSDQPVDLNRCIDIVEAFLDDTRDYVDRAMAINDVNVPDSVVHSLLVTLDRANRSLALFICDRSSVLTTWAEIGEVDDRLAVAANPYIDGQLRRQLVGDASELVRCQLARLWAAEDLEVFAAIICDPSLIVQEALAEALAEAREDDLECVGDPRPGGDESLQYLYDLVAAAEELDLLEEVRQDAAPYYGAGSNVIDDTSEVADSGRLRDGSGDDVDPVLTVAQIFGLLRDKLGAEVIEQRTDAGVTITPPTSRSPNDQP